MRPWRWKYSLRRGFGTYRRKLLGAYFSLVRMAPFNIHNVESEYQFGTFTLKAMV
jgi:hypothetical protein